MAFSMCLHTTIYVRMLLCIYARSTIYVSLRWPSAAVADTDYRRSPEHRHRHRHSHSHTGTDTCTCTGTGTGTGTDTEVHRQSVVNSFLGAQSLCFVLFCASLHTCTVVQTSPPPLFCLCCFRPHTLVASGLIH
jgi:hypothetical protein